MFLLTASVLLFLCDLVQCGAGLQATGGETSAPDEEAVPPGQPSVPDPALPPRGLHLHPQAQDQGGVQETRSLETLVSLATVTSDFVCWGFAVFNRITIAV